MFIVWILASWLRSSLHGVGLVDAPMHLIVILPYVATLLMAVFNYKLEHLEHMRVLTAVVRGTLFLVAGLGFLPYPDGYKGAAKAHVDLVSSCNAAAMNTAMLHDDLDNGCMMNLLVASMLLSLCAAAHPIPSAWFSQTVSLKAAQLCGTSPFLLSAPTSVSLHCSSLLQRLFLSSILFHVQCTFPQWVDSLVHVPLEQLRVPILAIRAVPLMLGYSVAMHRISIPWPLFRSLSIYSSSFVVGTLLEMHRRATFARMWEVRAPPAAGHLLLVDS